MKQVISKIQKKLLKTNFENKVFIVGGFVRDMLMGNDPHDIDLTIEGSFDDALDLVALLGGQNLVTFPEFGVARFTINNFEIEVTTTRKETYDPASRLPIVSQTTLVEDIKRRDFTINSLVLNISTGEVIDLVGGQNDIQSRMIRALDADQKFKDDPVRILRAVRFAARLGFNIESETNLAMMKNIARLSVITKERIRDEFIALLKTNSKALETLIQTGMMEFIIPNFDGFNLNDNGCWEIKLAVLLDKHNDVEKVLRDLKFSNVQIQLISNIIQIKDKLNNVSDSMMRRLVDEFGIDTLSLSIQAAKSTPGADIVTLNHLLDDLKFGKFTITDNGKVKPLLNGKDLMKMFGLKPSTLIKDLISFQLDKIFDNPDIRVDEMVDLLKDKI